MKQQSLSHLFALAVAALLLSTLAAPASAQYNFTNLDYPGAVNTSLLGHSGLTTGGYFNGADGVVHGWLLKKGVFSQYDVPGAWNTQLSAINHRGDFGGTFRDDLVFRARRRGFVVMNGVLTVIDYPGSTRTTVFHMNDRGQAVGIGRIPSEGAVTQPFGFIWEDGVFTEVSYPGAYGTGLDGINNQGDVCGFQQGTDGIVHAIMRVKGVFSSIEPPGAVQSIALSINDRGQVVGWYDDAFGGEFGYIYYKGVFTTIDPPGSVSSQVTTIDNNGTIFGDYLGVDGRRHAFIGTPIR
jgi:uncharacterized membrane protein